MSKVATVIPPTVTADEAVRLIQSGNRVYLHEAAMAPHELFAALARRGPELHDVETISLHTEEPAPQVAPELAEQIRHNALFVGANVREAVNAGRADYTPVFLSEVPRLIQEGPLKLDVATTRRSRIRSSGNIDHVRPRGGRPCTNGHWFSQSSCATHPGKFCRAHSKIRGALRDRSTD